MLTHIHPSRAWFACENRSYIKGNGCLSSMSEASPEPPSAQSPFARLGRYLRRRDLKHLVRGRYPSFIAHTDSCARPKSSLRLRSMPWSESLCRLSSAPAGRWPFPTLSPQSVLGRLDPYPAVFLRCTYPFLPEELRPHVRSETFGTPNCLCNATSTEHAVSGLQSFRYVQAPMFARPPGCTHR